MAPTRSVTHIRHQNRYCPFDRDQILNLVLDHLAMDDSIWGNLFSADDPMAPQLEFRGGNGHTGKSIIIRSGTEPKPPTQNFSIWTKISPFGPQRDITWCVLWLWKDNINCAEIECNSLKLNFNVCTAGFGCESRFVAAACPCGRDLNLLSVSRRPS